MSTHAEPHEIRELHAQLKRDHERLNQMFDPVVLALRDDEREEHAHMLSLITKLKVGTERHRTRLDMVEELVAQLFEHGERADGLLDRWAQLRTAHADPNRSAKALDSRRG